MGRGMKFITRTLLRLAEYLFLKAYGWKRINSNSWNPPKKHLGYKIIHTTNHAINSQKYYLNYKPKYKPIPVKLSGLEDLDWHLEDDELL